MRSRFPPPPKIKRRYFLSSDPTDRIRTFLIKPMDDGIASSGKVVLIPVVRMEARCLWRRGGRGGGEVHQALSALI